MTHTCPDCNFTLYHVVAELQVSVLALYSDERFPGRALLSLYEHHENFADMPEDLAIAFLNDIRVAGRAIAAATSCRRVNYAVLGNAEPHVHAHIIPRYHDDPVPTKAPWAHPDVVTPMTDDALTVMSAMIRLRLRIDAAHRKIS